MKQFHELFINDVSAGVYGIWLEKAPAIPVAKERGTWQNMPGMDGGYFVSENAMDSVELKLNLYIDADRDINQAIDYLMSAQTVRVAPWLWEWEVSTHDSTPTCSEWLEIPGEGYVAEISYRAMPYRVVWPHAGVNITLTSGQTKTITNPYATSLPVITLGSGCTLVIGDVSMRASGGSVTIDCKKRKIDNPQRLTISSTSGVYRPKWAVLDHGDTTVRASGGTATITADWRMR